MPPKSKKYFGDVPSKIDQTTPSQGKARASKNVVGATTNELILKQIVELYDGNERDSYGFSQIGKELNLRLFTPREQIRVLLIGPHSSGKSSFINWYCGEHLLKTGVAIETQGFSVVMSGRRRETVTGPGSLVLMPWLKELEQVAPGCAAYLRTETSESVAHNFRQVMLVDSPGLVDGSFVYPFDVHKAIIHFADHVDLIFCFLDPLGQALCARLISVLEELLAKHESKLKFKLTKADDVTNPSDLHKVILQISQNLSTIYKGQFELPTMYIPSKENPSSVPNHIHEATKEIENAINQNVQQALNELERDSDSIVGEISKQLKENYEKASANSSSRWKGLALMVTAFSLVLLLVASHLTFAKNGLIKLLAYVTEESTASAVVHSVIFEQPSENVSYTVAGTAALLFLIALVLFRRRVSTFSAKTVARLKSHKQFALKAKATKASLYEKFFNEFIINE